MPTSDEVITVGDGASGSRTHAAADLAARIRAKLDELFVTPATNPTVEDIQRQLQATLADLHTTAPDIKLAVHPDGSYTFNYTMQTAIIPRHTYTLERPTGMTDETWAALCAELKAAVAESSEDNDG